MKIPRETKRNRSEEMDLDGCDAELGNPRWVLGRNRPPIFLDGNTLGESTEVKRSYRKHRGMGGSPVEITLPRKVEPLHVVSYRS